jgi:hypothetical protein
MNKLNPHTYILFFLLIIINFSCSKSLTEEENRDPNQKELETDYVFIDNLNDSQEWDAAILGKEGLNYFYKFNEGMPEKFAIWDNNNDSLAIWAEFNDEGFPSCIVSGNYAYIMENYQNNTFDLTVTLNNEIIVITKGVEYDNSISTLNMARSRANANTENARITNAVISSISCAASMSLAIAGTTITGGVAAPAAIGLASIGCASAIVSIIDVTTDGEIVPPWLSNTLVATGCLTGKLDCFVSILQMGISIAGAALDIQAAQQIAHNAQSVMMSAVVKENKYSYVKIDLPINHNINPNNIQETDIQFGIFYGENPQLPANDRTRVKDEHLDWITLLNGNTIGFIELKNLKPNTTYYFMPYMLYGKALSTGEIKSFTTHGTVQTMGAAYMNQELIMSGEFDPEITNITRYGICYSNNNTQPTTSDAILISSNHDKGGFSVTLSNVEENQTYYYRAFITVDEKTYLADNVENIKTEETHEDPLIIGHWGVLNWTVESHATNEEEEEEIPQFNWPDDFIINADHTFSFGIEGIKGQWYYLSNEYIQFEFRYKNEEGKESTGYLPFNIITLNSKSLLLRMGGKSFLYQMDLYLQRKNE